MTNDSQSESVGVVSSTAWLDRIAQLDALIEPLEDERAALKQQLLESKSEIKPGDIITWNKGKRMARVLNIIPWVCGEPMWKVVKIRKDGTEGSICEVRPYDKPIRSNACVSDGPAGAPELTRSAEGPFAARNG